LSPEYRGVDIAERLAARVGTSSITRSFAVAEGDLRRLAAPALEVCGHVDL
jgi:hypothetical protein